MKQTAVEFLVDEFKEKLIGHNVPEWVEKIIQQAKAMEKNNYICSKCKFSLDGKDMQQMQNKENT